MIGLNRAAVFWSAAFPKQTAQPTSRAMSPKYGLGPLDLTARQNSAAEKEAVESTESLAVRLLESWDKATEPFPTNSLGPAFQAFKADSPAISSLYQSGLRNDILSDDIILARRR